MSGTSSEMLQEVTTSEEATIELACRFAEEVSLSGILTLSGELGAGKTRFARGIVRAMGGSERAVSSPTYAIVNEYDSAQGTIGHMDAYRLSGEDELETVGWDELLERCAVVLIEWGERIESALDMPRYDVRIDHVSEHERRITITRIEGL